ncbi:DUF371 domain-containing protein [Candidatus Bathyarchaeota archaeon]|jgi:uncharacterized protein|nr:DUF371 domain-containing protein [Candidatus Bathyarchaeota archaeon]MBT4320244.1 DUF371 domain-containing protein [Candidatus Bathyarchaeota archaeon]MBT4423413.1 DUF371 domain-containing protein [Candidatus Bathyarchaeota archaeon]MBT6605369.1 DUF371 domain-containing protein [Candidatus Bathyarchaeota archaeon]MBT7186256.1 DUF371 domain-containing protein [Candidatus Bathyarchaeota archaeon]
MPFSVKFTARGHPNVKSTHKTTFMTTTEDELSTRGDCIIVVGAGMGLKDIPDEVKRLAREYDTRITFRLTVDDLVFEAQGYGHPHLGYTDPIDMVARRSSFTCGRTLMIGSDKTSVDIPEAVVIALKNSDAVVQVEIVYEK